MGRYLRRIAFVSPCCVVDATSGAAIATVQALELLSNLGFGCDVFCGSWLDAPGDQPIEEMLLRQGCPVEVRRPLGAGDPLRVLATAQAGVPVRVFPTPTRHRRWESAGQSEAFLAAYREFLDEFRPDVLLTYGGDPVSLAVMQVAKRRGVTVVFCLRNFAYHHAADFHWVDYVFVPSDFSRRHYWQKLGLLCHLLPNVIFPKRVKAESWQPRYVTFINPEATKGVYVFARIAEQLARRRPDIPLLVVEGRRQSGALRETGVEMDWGKVSRMANTPDPREFYGVTKLLLAPSLWNESFGGVAAQAMLNGIPVLASNRGALPETVGAAGFLFDIPACYTPQTRTLPMAEEVLPWVETIIRLWDDQQFYQQSSAAARLRAQRWCPEQLATTYREFFGNIFPQPGRRTAKSQRKGVRSMFSDNT